MKHQIKNKRKSSGNKEKNSMASSGAPSATAYAPDKREPVFNPYFYPKPLIPLLFTICRLAITGLLVYRSFSRYISSPRLSFYIMLGVFHTLFITLDMTVTLMAYRQSSLVPNKRASYIRQIYCYLKYTTNSYYILHDLLFITLVFGEDKQLPVSAVLFSFSSILVQSLKFFFLCKDKEGNRLQVPEKMEDKVIIECTITSKPSCDAYLCCDGKLADEVTRRESDSGLLPTSSRGNMPNECCQASTACATDSVCQSIPVSVDETKTAAEDISTFTKATSSSKNTSRDKREKTDKPFKPSYSASNSQSIKQSKSYQQGDSNTQSLPSAIIDAGPCVDEKILDATKQSHVISISSSGRGTVPEPADSNVEQPLKTANHISLSAHNASSTVASKKHRTLNKPCDLSQSSQGRPPAVHTPRRQQRAGKRVISDTINTTINIPSDSIPRSTIDRVASEKESNTSAPTVSASKENNAGGYTGQTPKLDSIDLGVDESGDAPLDLGDLTDLNQYGQDNIKCIGAATTCETHLETYTSRSNVIKNITSSLFVFTSTPTKDIVTLPHTPSQTGFKQVILPVSEKQLVTLSESDMLILAAKNNDMAAIEMYKEFTGSHDSSGMFALAYCVLANNVAGVKALLSESKMHTTKSMRFNDVEYVDVDALMISILANADREIIEILAPISNVSIEGYSSMTALMLAASSGNVPAVELLVSSQQNLKTKDGRTALMIAAESGRDSCVEILLKETSEACSQNSMGWTALCFAADNGHVACVRLLAPKESMMMIIFAYDRYSASGFVMNFMSGTSLMLAAWHGSAECVDILKHSEAKIKTHKYENTALIFAATAGHDDCVKLLIDVEAKIQDSSGRTALMKAVTENNVSCVKLLAPVESGMVDERGTPAIVFAARKNHLDCVSLLAPYEADAFHHLILNRNWCSPEVERIIKKNLHKKGHL